MAKTDLARGFSLVEEDEDYNYQHFRPRHVLQELRRIINGAGVQPGAIAPDFDLPQVGGGTLQLSTLHGRAVLLHFVSFT
jgi:hypothetical protein